MNKGGRYKTKKSRNLRVFAIVCILSLWAGAMASLGGCASNSVFSRSQYKTREQAFSLIDEGHKLEAEGSPLLAIKRFNRAATIYQSPQAYFEMGRVYEAIGQQDEAAAAYQQALLLAPDYQEASFALLSMGYKPVGSHPSQQDLEQAQIWAEQRPLPMTIPSAAGDESATSATVIAEATAQDIEDIFGDAAHRRMPTPEEVRGALFTAKGDSGDLPSALSPDFPSEQDIILGTYPYHFRKAEQMRRKRQFVEAADEYQNAMQADPTQSEARLSLGDMMMKMEHFPQARFHYERAIEDFPQQPKPYLKMGNYYLANKQPGMAREFYHKAIERDPQYGEAINNLAVLSMQEKDYANATVLLDKLIEMDPAYANAYLNRGIIASDVDKDPKAALGYFKEYVNLGGERSVQARQWIQDLEASNP